MRTRSIALALLLGVLIAGIATADIARVFSYQGILTDAMGAPIANQSKSVEFSIWTADLGGGSLWTETRTVNTDGNGAFTIVLGENVPIPNSAFDGTNRWLAVKIPPDPELLPRTRLTAVGYAYRVSSVDGAIGGYISGDLRLDTSLAASGNVYRGGQLFLHDYGTRNLFLGKFAGNLTMTGGDNTCFGFNTGSSLTTGSQNTALGAFALNSTSTGESNVAVGGGALSGNTIGDNNTAVGSGALQNCVDALSNVAVGYGALLLNVTGDGNTAVGATALIQGTGIQNTAIGYSVMSNTTTGLSNTACGMAAMLNNVSGNSNTAVGISALSANTTGSGNTAIGNSADVSSGGLNNATAIGSGAIVNASNKVRIGNSSVTVIEGQVAYTFTSDKNQKENFQAVDPHEILDKIHDLDVTSWNYIGQDPDKFRHYGPVAQDFYAAFGHDGIGTIGSETTINSGDMAGILMLSIKALRSENEQMKQENAELISRLEKLELQLQDLIDGKIAELPNQKAAMAD